VYESDGFCERNRDTIQQEAVDMMHASLNPVVREFFPAGSEGAGLTLAHMKSKITSMAASMRPKRMSAIASKTVGAQFKKQLLELMRTIRATDPHYVRCIKPNDHNSADVFDPHRVVEQLRCGGVLEAVRVARAGYPSRLPHAQFIVRYRMLESDPERSASLVKAVKSGKDPEIKNRAKVLLAAMLNVQFVPSLADAQFHDLLKQEGVQFGLTKVSGLQV
jgi:myosin-5